MRECWKTCSATSRSIRSRRRGAVCVVQLRKRFYQSATIGEGAPHPVLLDGRAGEDAGGRTLAAPACRSREAIAAEWNAQGERIDPATMPLTRLANTIIDGVAPNPEPIAEEIAKYLGSDLLCYRARRARRAGRRAGTALGPGPRLGARGTRRALRAERRRDVRRAAAKPRSRPRAPRFPPTRGGSAPSTSSPR